MDRIRIFLIFIILGTVLTVCVNAQGAISNQLIGKSKFEQFRIISSEVNKIVNAKTLPYQILGTNNESNMKMIILSASLDDTRLKINMRAYRNGREIIVHNPVFLEPPPIYTKTGTENPDIALGEYLTRITRNFPYGPATFDNNDPILVVQPTADIRFGNLTYSGLTFSQIRNGPGTNLWDTEQWIHPGFVSNYTTASLFNYSYRAGVIFDTSFLSGTIITAADLDFYSYLIKTQLGATDYGINITGYTPKSYLAPHVDDYQSFLSTDLGNANYDSTIGYHNITLNSNFFSFCNVTGHTALMIRDTWDFKNTFEGVWASNSENKYYIYAMEFGSNSPYLRVTYTYPYPTAAITGSNFEIEVNKTGPNEIWWWWDHYDDKNLTKTVYVDNSLILTNTTNTYYILSGKNVHENEQHIITIELYNISANTYNGTFTLKSKTREQDLWLPLYITFALVLLGWFTVPLIMYGGIISSLYGLAIAYEVTQQSYIIYLYGFISFFVMIACGMRTYYG
jgi:hypothetical protein